MLPEVGRAALPSRLLAQSADRHQTAAPTSRAEAGQSVFGRIWALPESMVDAAARAARATSPKDLEPMAAVFRGQARQATPTIKGAVAILPIAGLIFPRPTFATLLGYGTAAESFARQFRASVADSNVGAIVIDINSPGGSVQGIEELAREIFNARGAKPIIAVANHLAASAAYWIGAAAGEFIATPSAEVGSIGVFAQHDDISQALEQAGVKVTLISAGRFKVEASPYEPLGDTARRAIQARVDDYFAMFAGSVARGRGVSAATVREGFGQGRAVGAQQAWALGMVDRIATLQQTIDRLTQRKATSGPVGQSAAADLAARRARIRAMADLDRRRERARTLQADPLRDRLRAAEVEAATIAPAVRQRVATTWAACVQRLQLRDAIALRWASGREIRPTAGAHLAAHGEIWLADNLSADQAALTAAHELRHVWQTATFAVDSWQLSEHGRRWCEADAEEFAHQVCYPAAA